MERFVQYPTMSISLAHILQSSCQETESDHGMSQALQYKQAVANASCIHKLQKWRNLDQIYKDLFLVKNIFIDE